MADKKYYKNSRGTEPRPPRWEAYAVALPLLWLKGDNKIVSSSGKRSC
jgi:hypothetical protein